MSECVSACMRAYVYKRVSVGVCVCLCERACVCVFCVLCV